MHRNPVASLWIRIVSLVALSERPHFLIGMLSLRAFGLALLPGILGLWSAPWLHAQNQPKSEWDGWRAISHIKGVATAENISHDEDVDEGTTRTNGFAAYHFELIPEELTELPLLARQRVPGMPSAIDLARMKRANTSSLGWEAMEAPTVSDQYHYFNVGSRADPGSMAIDFDYNGKVEHSDVDSGAQFSIDLRRGTWNFHALQSEYEKPAEMTVVWTGEDARSWTEKRIRAEIFIINADQPLPKQPQALIASFKLINPPIESHPNAGGSRTYNVRLWPEFEDVKLDVIVADYEKWRPLGNISNPKKPGNTLKIVAELKPRNKDAVTNARPKSITFELKDTSHEPGVCLNWPLGATDKDPDLKLAEDTMYSGKPDDNGQKLIVKDPKADDRGFYIGQSLIESYDFGSRAEVYVTAQMEDGRTIVGTFTTAAGDDDLVNLPEGRKDGDWVAMSWRKSHDVVDVPDDDDSEGDPKGDGNKGDGFTLYEEYRGFVENGQRIEGDPKKKDFFVQNLVGDKANAGIGLFTSLSQLNVHDHLQATEMASDKRLMNGNHRDAPHRVDQHGVWIKEFSVAGLGVSGAAAVGVKDNVSLRPGLTKGIGIAAPNDPKSVFNKSYNLSAADQATTYKRAIAHELLHAVGVEHHGKGDYSLRVSFLSPDSKKNPLHKPAFHSGDGTIITLLTESGEDKAIAYYAKYKEARDWMKMVTWKVAVAQAQDMLDSVHQTEPSAEEIAEQLIDSVLERMLAFDLSVGVEHGEDSGDQDCIMRYYFSNAYPARGRPNTFYVTEPGTEPIGQTLCSSSKGTGINGGGHQPQSRYGDASGGLGNCAEQICPNDAIPPKKH